jgi:threonine dehydratase
MGQRWNISMFHYRNHGSAYGRVLMGFQVEAESDSEFRDFLENANFPYIEETENPVYEVFLK